MGLFTKLFKNNSKPDNPDNYILLELLDVYRKRDGQRDTYKNVVIELMNGNSFLIFPTKNGFKTTTDGWTAPEKDTVLKLAVVNVDGLKTLEVFTDEQAMLKRIKDPTEYTAMRSRDVLNLCKDYGMDRIVINCGQPNMFFLERSKENIKEHHIKHDVKVELEKPNKPLPGLMLQKILENFKKNNTILEVYQYEQTNNGEFSIVLGFKLSVYSENAKRAAINSVQNVVENEKLDQPLDLFFLETDVWYAGIKRIENTLIYKK